MKHTLRKYLSSRGSALFMVLSTMTALLIVVMAMYFSVVSSRSVQYAVFNQEQSYQSAISISDALIAGLNNNQFPTLTKELVKITEGTSLTTNGNDFKSLVGTGTQADDERLGAYDVTITRLNDEKQGAKTYYVYDFAVVSSVNGVNEVTHSIIRLEMSGNKPTVSDRTFTATGYLPNENWLGSTWYCTDVHIDSEYVTIGGIGGTPNFYDVDFVTAGSAYLEAGGHDLIEPNKFTGDTKPHVWAFGGNLTINKSTAADSKLNMAGTAAEHGMIIVGGDLIVEGSGSGSISGDTLSGTVLGIAQYTDVYVLGDVYVDNVGYDHSGFNGNLFVGGTLHALGVKSDGGPSKGTLYLKTANPAFDTDLRGNTNTVDSWLTSGDYPGSLAGVIFSISDVESKLNEAIGSNNYPKWPETDFSSLQNPDKTYNSIDILFNSSTDIYDITSGGWVNNNVSFWNGSETITYPMGIWNADGTVTEFTTDRPHVLPSAKIGDYYLFESEDLKYSETNKLAVIGNIHGVNRYASGSPVNTAIIIDTGDDPGNVFDILLPANRDEDGDGKNETFSWAMQEKDLSDGYGTATMVMIKGKGTVVFHIPEGVTYQNSGREFVGHMNWYALGGWDNGGSFDDIKKFIHNDCDGSNKCTYTEITSGDDAGKFKCSVHDCVVEAETDALGNIVIEDGLCPCHFRVGRTEINSYLASNTLSVNSKFIDFVDNDSNNSFTYGTDEFVYPTTNVWFESCDENADIRLCRTKPQGVNVNLGSSSLTADKNSAGIGSSTLFGFVYAPYMTFSGLSMGSGSEGVRMVGGLVVSDLVINDWQSYLYIKPEKNYTDLIGDAPSKLPSYNDYSWRKYGY